LQARYASDGSGDHVHLSTIVLVVAVAAFVSAMT
jgi:hypothetical protein